MHPCANHHRTRPICRIGTIPAIPDISVAYFARSVTRLDLWMTRLHLHNLGAISLYLAILTVSRDSEIAPRLCRCSLVTHRSIRVTERAQHATEVSGMAGIVPIRQSGRVRWWLTHGCWSGFYGNLRTRAKTLQDAPMRQSPPYSTTLSNRSKPGRSGYLHCMLCTLREVVTPLDGLGPYARSRRNLVRSFCTF